MSNPNKPDAKKASPGIMAAYAHAKLDGHFTRIERVGDGVRFTTSNPTDITRQMPHDIYTAAFALPSDSSVLGELWVPNRPASCVKTALKERWRTLELTYFAIERVPGMSQRQIETMWLEDTHDFFNDLGLQFAPYEALGTSIGEPREMGEAELEHLKARARMSGLEGWMLKTSNLQDWYKLKCENTIDVVITGVKDGGGKYIGQVGSLVCSVNYGLQLVEIAAVSGMNDEQRLDITEAYDDDPNSIIGKVAEIQYQRVDAKGRLRHPRFKRFRDDKQASECLHDQDPDLARFVK